jgi:hypothetical protein
VNKNCLRNASANLALFAEKSFKVQTTVAQDARLAYVSIVGLKCLEK